MKIYLYNFIFLSILLISCEFKVLSKKWYKNILLSYFIFLFGQRWSAGIDFYGYLDYYLINFKTEIGYRFIQDIFSKYNIYFGIIIFLIYIFTTVTSVWFIQKFSKSNYLLYIYFLSEYHIMSINPLRTYIAINFFLLGIYYSYFYLKKFKGLFFILIGSLFHQLIIFSIPFLYFLNFKKIIKSNKKILLFIIGILPILPIYKILENIIGILIIYFPKYKSYVGGVYDIPLSAANIIRYYIFFILYIFYNQKSPKDKIYNFLDRGILIYMFLIGLSTHFAPLHRVAYFYKIFEILYFANFFNYKNYSLYKRLIILIFIFNYFAIWYKDMGVLKYYELKILHLYNDKTSEEYKKEIQVDIIRKNLYMKIRER